MLTDQARTDAYRRALSATVRPGDVVLDVGAGTAILGMLAAQAGARKVYAIELTGIAALAQRLVSENGLDGRVDVIQGDAETVTLPEKVDLIVGEVWGYIGVDENLLATLLVCRDRWLKPGGTMLPHTMTSWMAPVHDNWLDHELRFWHSRPYGLDLSAIAELSVDEVRGEQHHITRESLLAERQRLWTTDVRTTSVADARRAFEAHVGFVASRRGRLSGLAAWFSMEFPDGTTLANGPDDPPTHWGCEVLPLRSNIEVEAGTPIEARLRCEPAEVGVRHQQWSARVRQGEWEEHGTRSSGA
jgi:SAM-dependent methyltransferase